MRNIFWGIAALAVMGMTGVGLLSLPAVQDRLMAQVILRNLDPASRAELFEDDALRLLVCGSSSPFPAEDRARPCLAVVAGGKFYVVDTGPGSWNRLALLRIPGERIGGVLFTHFHSDHIGDLGEFNMQTWVAGRGAALPVYGPAGVERVVAGFQDAYALDNGYRIAHHGAELLPEEHGRMDARPQALDTDGGMTTVLDDGALKIRMFAVNHAPIEPAVGYRFDYKGRSLVISGDTAKSDALVAAAKGVDVLAHEAQNQEMVARIQDTAKTLGRARMDKVMGDIPSYHTSPVDAAQAANAAGVETLLLYHLTPPPPNRLAEKVFLRGVAQIRSQGTVLARDGLLIELPLAGGAARVRQLK